MIQCPICQMINEDQTRFCAECGARLGPVQPPAQSPAPQAPSSTMQGRTEPPPQPKLHSPILDGAEPPGRVPPRSNPQNRQELSDLDRLKRISGRPEVPQTDGVPRNPYDPRSQQSASAPPETGTAATDKSARRLRSPLLSGEEFDDQMGNESPPPDRKAPTRDGMHQQSKPHLHSPLLGDAVEHDSRDFEGKRTGGKRKHLHSPLLNMEEEEDDYYEDEQNSARGGLHSPLLGSGGGLRSPMLQGHSNQNQYNEDDYDYDPYAEEDNPNILRSPLLSAKISLDSDKSVASEAKQPGQAPAAKPGQMQPANYQGQFPATNQNEQTRQEPGMAFRGRPDASPVTPPQAHTAAQRQVSAPAEPLMPPSTQPPSFRQAAASESEAPFIPGSSQRDGAPNAAIDRSSSLSGSQSKASHAHRALPQSHYESQDDEDNDFASKRLSRHLSTESDFHAGSQTASIIPKILGGMALLMVLLKLPNLMLYLQSVGNPQYMWQSIDAIATTLALVFIGLGLLMSKY